LHRVDREALRDRRRQAGSLRRMTPAYLGTIWRKSPSFPWGLGILRFARPRFRSWLHRAMQWRRATLLRPPEEWIQPRTVVRLLFFRKRRRGRPLRYVHRAGRVV